MEWEDEKTPEDAVTPEDENTPEEENTQEDDEDLESLRLLRLPELLHLLGLGKSTFYKMVREGHFPKPICIGSRRVGWPRRVVVRWIKQRPSAD